MRRIAEIPALLFLMIGGVVLGNAQSKSRLCGTVRDEQSVAIPIAIVEAKSSKGKTFKINVDSEGSFDTEIADGLYKILITASGYKRVVLKRQFLTNDPGKCIDITLKSSVPPHQIT